MSKGFLFIIALVLCFLSFFETNAQSLLKNGKILKDLVIKFETESVGPPSKSHYKITIEANGTVWREAIAGFFAETSNLIKKNKLTKNTLRQLVSEFERIGFFNLDNDYSFKAGNCGDGLPIPHKAKVIISIRINGKTKKVSSVQSCVGDEGSNLENFDNLGKKISLAAFN